MKPKELYIIAGPNGSGKTTFAKELVSELNIEFVNINSLAKNINPNNIDEVKIEAGKKFFEQIEILSSKNVSFAIESTLAGTTLIRRIEYLRNKNYKIIILYIFIECPKLGFYRIKCNMKKGGHKVKECDIDRRFIRSINNFWNLYQHIADEWFLFYNSDNYFEDFAIGKNQVFEITEENIFKKFISYSKCETIDYSLTANAFEEREIYNKVTLLVTIGNNATKKALTENKQYNLPAIYSYDQKIIFELPNGEVTNEYEYRF